MNKKILLLLGILTVSAGVLAGCSNTNSPKDSKTSVSTMQGDVTEDVASENTSEVIGKVEQIKDFIRKTQIMSELTLHTNFVERGYSPLFYFLELLIYFVFVIL